MIRVGVVGMGKMGLSHLSIFRAHPQVELAGICDSNSYLLSVLGKYTGIPTYSSYETMLTKGELDAVVIATPSALHAPMVRTALDRGLHVFCEKPFCLDPAESEQLTALAEQKALVTAVGYHYRFVGTFAEVKRLLDAGAIGEVTLAQAEAFGPVVLKRQGTTWRSKKQLGGGSLYDYAAHPLNLLNWYLGSPSWVGGTVLQPVFSAETDDQVAGTLRFDSGATGQISVNWSDESERKMSTKITLWGTKGRIHADRQELQVYLREEGPAGYRKGWTVKYTTELTKDVWFYLRGEEYSAQADDFITRIADHRTEGVNSFASASATDQTLALMVADAEAPAKPRGGLRRLIGR
ncbi:putative dehydrogenase [Propionicimonas paludicola]|uniref:Putative dehydrogenase n=1 Tax=Propionicimonas paludicola TaxID=185243 RepID=A0A2A9CMG1_9ACTN|nr:Gfo/Idh/MocA family oxidoreductase [Propionicimonas paludicola]PFG15647.1 putative dehydrogenase [Propionicimonas paludicola]